MSSKKPDNLSPSQKIPAETNQFNQEEVGMPISDKGTSSSPLKAFLSASEFERRKSKIFMVDEEESEREKTEKTQIDADSHFEEEKESSNLKESLEMLEKNNEQVCNQKFLKENERTKVEIFEIRKEENLSKENNKDFKNNVERIDPEKRKQALIEEFQLLKNKPRDKHENQESKIHEDILKVLFPEHLQDMPNEANQVISIQEEEGRKNSPDDQGDMNPLQHFLLTLNQETLSEFKNSGVEGEKMEIEASENLIMSGKKKNRYSELEIRWKENFKAQRDAHLGYLFKEGAAENNEARTSFLKELGILD